MSHQSRVRRHISVDILASVVGGAAVSAVVQKSWWLGGLAVLVAVALAIFEQGNIEEEEK
jgi:fatty acid desaturase